MQNRENLEGIEMMNLHAVLVDLGRCVGCQTCEVACKQENGLKEGEKWIEVITIGPEEVGDKLCADYYPVINAGCQFCSQRTSQGLDPFCIAACPTKALKFCNVAEILVALRSKKRYQICGVDQGK